MQTISRMIDTAFHGVGPIKSKIERIVEDAVEAEREACAKWHDDKVKEHEATVKKYGPIYAENMSLLRKIAEHKEYAAAIRART